MKDPKPVKCPKCSELMYWMKSVETTLTMSSQTDGSWEMLDDSHMAIVDMVDVEDDIYDFWCPDCNESLEIPVEEEKE